MSEKISVVINTYNASRYLDRVLRHTAGFDEVVVCDMESTDDTVGIARRHGCRVVTFPKGNHNICEPARDFAIHSAAHKWVLVVDADELVPDTLRAYLYGRIADGTFDNALAVPRINLFMGEPMKEKTDYQVRFFQRDKTHWPPTIHSHPEIDGRIERIPAREELSLQHLDNPPIASRIAKMNRYTDNEMARRAAKRYGAMALLGRPAWFFIKSYLLQGGIRHGRRGIVNAYMAAMYQMSLMAKVVECQTPNSHD